MNRHIPPIEPSHCVPFSTPAGICSFSSIPHLAYNGGTFSQSSAANSTLNLQTNVSSAASSTEQAVFERPDTGAFEIELDGAERTFAVTDSSTLAVGVSEMGWTLPSSMAPAV